MSIREIHRTIDWIDKEIRLISTGTPNQLAGRLKMSVRLLYYYLDMMKQLGAPIEYSSKHESFVYTTKGKFINGSVWQEDICVAC